MKISTLLQLALASLISLSVHASPVPQTFLSFTSEPGDSIGQGNSDFFTPAEGNFVVNTSPVPITDISFFFDPGLGEPWSGGNFSSAGLGAPLAVGQYDDAQWNGAAVAGHPGINLFIENHSSNSTIGSFHIYDLSFDANNLVQSFAVTFEQFSDGSSAALNGAFWYNSFATVPDPSVVPEPATYLLMLAGLGLVGFASRKKQNRSKPE